MRAVDLATLDTEQTTNTHDADLNPSDGGETTVNSVDEPADEWSALASLDIGTEIAVKRQSPEWCEGWLTSVNQDENGPAGILDRVKAVHGGGTYLLQPKKRISSGKGAGKLVFARGAIRVKISGFPIVDGIRCNENGPITEPAPAAPATPPTPYPPYPMQYPPPQSDNGIQSQLMGLVGKALSKGDATVDLAGVINALNGLGVTATPQAQQTIDPYKQVRQTLELTQLLREANPPQAPEPEKPDMMSKAMELLMMKMMSGGMGGMSGAPAQQPRPAARPAARRQPPASAQPPAYGPATPQPTPNHVWHPTQGWVAWEGASEAHTPPAAEPIPPSPQGGGEQSSADEQDDYVAPIEPDELIGELQHKSSDERAAFVRDVLAGVSEDPELQQAFMAGLAEFQGPESGSPMAGDEVSE